MKDLGKQPAFPVLTTPGGKFYQKPGMDIRTYLVGKALQGIMGQAIPSYPEHYRNIAEDALKVANEVIKQLEKEDNK